MTEVLFGAGEFDESAIGVAGFCQELSSTGSQVTLLWVPSPETIDESKLQDLKRYYYEYFLITLEVLREAPNVSAWLGWREQKSAAVYYFLKEQEYDSVYFALEGGLGYYSLLGKEQGLFSPRPRLAIIAHTPMDWVAQSDRFFLGSTQQVAASYMEKLCVELADQLVCVSESMLGWLKSQGWKLPKSVLLISPNVPAELSLSSEAIHNRSGQSGFGELVVLAGSSFKDGLTFFCDVADELARLDVSNLKITAFGPFGQILGEHTGGMLVRRARRWPFQLQIFPQMSHRQALEYCRRSNALAVIPGLDSGTGYWLKACSANGVPVVATAVGANKELLKRKEDRFSPRSGARNFAKDIFDRLTGQSKHQALSLPHDSPEKFLRALSSVPMGKATRQLADLPKQKQPLVSIVMVHHDRPQYLLQAIDAVKGQTYQNFELVLVDDGSQQPESKLLLDRLEKDFKVLKWKLIRQENKYLGAARNSGVRASRGKFVLFVDDDNALFPDAVNKFVTAMENSKADICTAFQKVFCGDRVPASEDIGKVRYFPLGGSLDLGFIWDTFGDANAMVRRSTFDKIGYQVEDYGFTAHDWEYFARASLAGLKLRVIPEPLYWYRSSTQAMYRTSHWYENRLPIIEVFKKYKFRGVEHLYHLALAEYCGDWEKKSLRENLRRSQSDASYLKLAELEANSPQAIELLASIAAAEGRPETALSLLATSTQDGFRSLATNLLGVEPHATRAMRDLSGGLMVERSLEAQQLREFVSSSGRIAGEIPLCYSEGSDRLYLEARHGDVAIAVLPGGCPPATVGLRLTALLDQEMAASADVMVMLVPLGFDPLVAVQGQDSKPTQDSSGWVKITNSYVTHTLEIDLAAPSSEPLHLVLAVRSRDLKLRPALGCFSAITFKLALGAESARRTRLGPPASKHRARAMTEEEIRRAKLSVAYESKLPLLLFDRNNGGIFLRPNKQGPVVATIPWALPSLARGVIGKVEIAHDEASPFEFSIALTEHVQLLEWSGEKPQNCLGFSGWIQVSKAFKLHDVAARLDTLHSVNLDIHLAIRLPRGSSPSPANAFWRKLILVWDE